MGLLVPLALAFAALGLPILIFYMLKLRREERVISSTMLWQQVIQDREANAPWQRLRRNLLLLLQLIILFLLVLALTRPYSEIQRTYQGNIIVLLDASASMQATDVAATSVAAGASPELRSANRFEVARAHAREIVDGLWPNDTLTLIAVADTPRVLASLTNDKSVLRQALSAAQVTNTEADWEAAFILASSSARQAIRNLVVILSDGGLPDHLPPLPGQISYIPVGIMEPGGSGADNLAISALAVRDGTGETQSRRSAGPLGPQAFLRVTNAGDHPVQTLVEIYVTTAASPHGALYDARTLSLDPGGESGLALDDLPLDTQQVEARLPADALSLDNTAWAVRTRSQQAMVMLLTPGNTFLERAAGLLPNLNLLTVLVTDTLTRTPITLPTPPPDLIILDGVQPAILSSSRLPPSNLLFVAPPTSTLLFQVGGPLTQISIVNMKTDSPLLRYVDLSDVHIARARAVLPPPWAETLIEATDGSSNEPYPLLLAGEVTDQEMGGRRVAVLAFDLHHSDLPLQIAYPILMANLLGWLAPTDSVDVPDGTSSALLRPGQPALLRPQMGVEEIAVTSPSGQTWNLKVEDGEPVPFAQTNELGAYTVEQKRGTEVVRTAFAVNLFSELESHIRPKEAIRVGQAEVGGQTRGEVGRREWWRWPALAALGVLLIEWVAHLWGRSLPWHFRTRAPGRNVLRPGK